MPLRNAAQTGDVYGDWEPRPSLPPPGPVRGLPLLGEPRRDPPARRSAGSRTPGLRPRPPGGALAPPAAAPGAPPGGRSQAPGGWGHRSRGLQGLRALRGGSSFKHGEVQQLACTQAIPLEKLTPALLQLRNVQLSDAVNTAPADSEASQNASVKIHQLSAFRHPR